MMHTTSSKSLIAPLVAGAVLAACSEPLASDPTWFGEVRELLAANCVRCHNGRSLAGLPSEQIFRLDRHVALDVDSIDVFDRQELISARALDYAELGLDPMPPALALGDREKQILSRWAANDYKRGERSNRAPELELIEPSPRPDSVDRELALAMRSFDGDGDGLIVELGYRVAASSDELIMIPLTSEQRLGGLLELTVDTAQFASGTSFDIVAVLDDGFFEDPAQNKTELVLLSNLLVDHGERGAAPAQR